MYSNRMIFKNLKLHIWLLIVEGKVQKFTDLVIRSNLSTAIEVTKTLQFTQTISPQFKLQNILLYNPPN